MHSVLLVIDSLNKMGKGFKAFYPNKGSICLNPHSAYACWGFLSLLDMIFYALTAVSVPGAIGLLAWTFLFNICHKKKIGLS